MDMSKSISTSILSNVASTVSSLLYSSENFELLGQEKEILKIGNVLNSLLINRNDIEIPKLVVVGSQSSGKSSILNSILGMDILPTGSNMVTRGPLMMELVQTKTDVKAVFGTYIDGNWNSAKEINIQYPNPTLEQRNEIAQTIRELTTKYAGDGMNITNIPLYLRIYSPNIPNLSLVDLPGLTMVACTDQGQPKDIKDRIKGLVGEYIAPKSTIILAVMPARTDIEADIGLDLIKEYDPNGERTLGILTKLDLMNEGTDVTHLLENKVSKDLQLNYGYFGIRNRNKIEMDNKSVIEGLKLEQEYFSRHTIYSNDKYKERLGIPALCRSLSNILVKSLKKNLPGILEKISRELDLQQKNLVKLGTSAPKDDAQKTAFVHKVIAKLTRNFSATLEDRGKIISSGRKIKQHFIEFRHNLNALEPFDNKCYKDCYFEEIIANCEGNHMSSPSPPIEVIEQILKDPSIRPLLSCSDLAQKCAQSVLNELIELVELLIEDLGIERFPHFSNYINHTCVNEIFIPLLKKTYKYIEDELQCQETYIWTENKEFSIALTNCNSSNIQLIRNLCKSYFKAVIVVLEDVIPKKIMYHLVSQTQKEMATFLYENLKAVDMSHILEENGEIHIQRNKLEKSIKELQTAKGSIEGIINVNFKANI
jgi:dynamin 1-like protein